MARVFDEGGRGECWANDWDSIREEVVGREKGLSDCLISQRKAERRGF